MFITLFGMMILYKFEHPSKAEIDMLETSGGTEWNCQDMYSHKIH